MASRRKRGPVAFRPRLSAGLALSLLLFKRSTNVWFVQSVNLIWLFSSNRQCRLWVVSGPSSSYQLKGRFRAHSGRPNR